MVVIGHGVVEVPRDDDLTISSNSDQSLKGKVAYKRCNSFRVGSSRAIVDLVRFSVTAAARPGVRLSIVQSVTLPVARAFLGDYPSVFEAQFHV